VQKTIRSTSPVLAYAVAVLLLPALGNPLFWRAVRCWIVCQVTILATVGAGAVWAAMLAVAFVVLRAVWQEVTRDYRGPSLWSILLTVGEWEARCLSRATENVLWLLDCIPCRTIGPIVPEPVLLTDADIVPACPACPFGACDGCEPIECSPVFLREIEDTYALFAGIPTATAFSPAPAFRPLAAPLARLLPSWEEREASCEPIALRPDTSSEQGPAFDTWKHENRGDDLGSMLPIDADPIEVARMEEEGPGALGMVAPSSRRWDARSQCWTAEPEREVVQVAACGPVHPSPFDFVSQEVIDGLASTDSLPSDATLDALALSTPETPPADYLDACIAQEIAARNAPQTAQDATEAPTPTASPDSVLPPLAGVLAKMGRDRCRAYAKLRGIPYSGKDSAATLRAKILAHAAMSS
jgi:hypothetical protein